MDDMIRRLREIREKRLSDVYTLVYRIAINKFDGWLIGKNQNNEWYYLYTLDKKRDIDPVYVSREAYFCKNELQVLKTIYHDILSTNERKIIKNMFYYLAADEVKAKIEKIIGKIYVNEYDSKNVLEIYKKSTYRDFETTGFIQFIYYEKGDFFIEKIKKYNNKYHLNSENLEFDFKNFSKWLYDNRVWYYRTLKVYPDHCSLKIDCEILNAMKNDYEGLQIL